MHGPTCIFWANLTPFLPKAARQQRKQTKAAQEQEAGAASPRSKEVEMTRASVQVAAVAPLLMHRTNTHIFNASRI
jgi:hypothetical protein